MTGRQSAKFVVSLHYTSPSLTVDKALTRDGFRCLLTGLFDETSTEEDPKLDAMCIQLDTGSTNVAPCRIWCKMQGVDPIGGSGTGRDFDKVCAIIFSSLPSLHLTINVPDTLRYHGYVYRQILWAQRSCSRSRRRRCRPSREFTLARSHLPLLL